MSHRRGTALTVLVVVVLAAATAGLTVAATSIVTARTEQLRQGRASDIQRMLDAGRQWVQAGGLNTAANPAAETITLQLPSFAGPADGSSLPGIEKQVEIKVEPDNQIRMTAKLQRVRGDTPLVFATRTIRFVPQPEGEN